MAGRILPLAAAAGIGVSIGIATFDGEFKEQRRKRLQEEYDREVAALASKSLTPMAANAIAPPSPQNNSTQLKAGEQDSKDSGQQSQPSWSSYIGLWAWTKNPDKQKASEGNALAPPQSQVDEKAGKP
ncbi:hypothetical protein IQ06DRAFT_349916 [Phaeosphaeriaceae sp. SRC1lsM3a]|nr:hypothetical protein IQ06DRAFT_349916 [Stagonospora sp. SRC1lsM3a]